LQLAFVACSLFQVPATLRKLSILDIGKVFLRIGSRLLILIIQPTAIVPGAFCNPPRLADPGVLTVFDAGRLFTGYSQAKPAILFLPAGEGWLWQ
jgi:hypothetical protein